MTKDEIEFNGTDSHMIYGHFYSNKEQALYLKFNTLAIWKYTPFSFKEYKEMMGSNSIGKHFNANIKDVKKAEIVK